jgi:uncharacterized protein (TIGR02687 family)
MSENSYFEAKQQLIKLFKSPTDNRHIVFWYDPAKNFEEDINQDSFDDAKVIIFKDNPFTIKTILEIKDPNSNYLIYCPIERPSDKENWLEDTLLYSEEYYADTVALMMRKLNLKSSQLRGSIEKHIHFFDAQSRINDLAKKIDLNDNTNQRDFGFAMMSVIVKNPTSYNKLEYILREIIFDYEDGEKYKQLVKFGFKDLFWSAIGEQYFYSGEENIKKLIDSFLVTSIAKKVTFKIETPVLKNLIIKDNSEEVEIFVNELLEADERYKELESNVYKELRIGELISAKGIDSLGTCDVFCEFDDFIIETIVNALANGSYDYDFYQRVIKDNRLYSRWYKDYESEYTFISCLIDFKKHINLEIDKGLDSEDYIKKYTDTYYLIDNYYRHLINAFSKISDPSDSEVSLVKDADNQYENKFLYNIGSAFSESLKRKEPTYSFGAISLSGDFFRSKVNRNVKKQFVIISDALRFEVGADLINGINQNTIIKGQAKLDYQITTLPSITMFGMAALLPNSSISYENKQVFIDGMPTNGTEARNKILQKTSSSYAAIQYDDLNKMSRTEIRNYMKDKSLVYIYHDVIDNAGEHDSDVFDACDKAIIQIIDLVKKLYNTLQISNFIITSDHGFIYRNKKIEESSKYKSFSFMGFDDYSQRYIVTKPDDKTVVDFTNKFSMNYLGNCNSNVIVPYGYDLFKKAGGGIQYIHGGSSLQELITPVIVLSELRSKSSENTTEPVKVRLKTLNHKIMNKSFALQFEQMEKVEGKKTEAAIKVYFVDDKNNVISDEKVFLANKTTDIMADRTIDMRFLLKNLDYDRNKSYFLVMKNANDESDVGESIPFVIDILKFKMF